ncbi:polysaccharide deacetylase family protein [Halocatena marina]|uniref:polysaccharide deacetylase family protein n=1 Tax=Halocatena marina TaxID=2934937 RepID=UPI0036090409
MQNQTTRRMFLAAVGATGAVSLAGCSSIPGNGGGGSEPKQPSNTTGSEKPSTTEPGATAPQQRRGKDTSSNRGSVVDDFEGDVDSRWGINNGKYKVTKKDAFQGSQSLVLEPKKNAKKPVAKIFKSFYPKALDLSKHDLSLAVKVNKPKDIKVSAEVIAPAESSMLTATRYIPLELDGWVRFDLGYTAITGNPTMDKVSQVNLQIGPLSKGQDFQILIDDLRKYPKPKKGKVMFQFDDGHITTYKKAYPILKKKGWPGSVGIIPDAINGDKRMTDQMMQEMGKSGWDMMAHASELLPKLPESKQRQILQQANQYLNLKGFKKGARHFVAPYNRVNQTTLDLIDELFETGYLFGACPNNAQHPSNPSFISRVEGPSVRGARRAINVAEKTNQLVVIAYHAIGNGNNATSEKAFKRIVNHVEKKNVDVITPSQLVDGKNW